MLLFLFLCFLLLLLRTHSLCGLVAASSIVASGGLRTVHCLRPSFPHHSLYQACLSCHTVHVPGGASFFFSVWRCLYPHTSTSRHSLLVVPSVLPGNSCCLLTDPPPLCGQRVELKNGEAYNGTLFTSDGWMNLVLKQVICTSRVLAVRVFFGFPSPSACDSSAECRVAHAEKEFLSIRHRCVVKQRLAIECVCMDVCVCV